jgi:hypothetical protein
MEMVVTARALLAVLVVSGALACSSSSGDPNGGACKDELPRNAAGAITCPATVPSYASAVSPIVREACLACHAANGTAGVDLSTYAALYAQRSASLDQLSGCLMPPQNGIPLGDAQRGTLLSWLVCGAPDN